MRFHGRLALAGLTAAFVLAAAVSTASANRLSLSERGFQTIWTAPLSGGGGGEIASECQITLRGSFHSATLAKVAAALVGHIFGATVGSCITGGTTVLRETLPWHLRYQSFTGTLPRITGVTLQNIGASFRVEEGFGQACLYRTTATNPSRLIAEIEANGLVTGLRADETATIPMTGPFPCELTENASTFRGTASFTRTGTTNLISIRLI
jgi:hypothetical protein